MTHLSVYTPGHVVYMTCTVSSGPGGYTYWRSWEAIYTLLYSTAGYQEGYSTRLPGPGRRDINGVLSLFGTQEKRHLTVF